MATINGTNAADRLDGTAGDDVINGNGGNDTIYGGGGRDLIDGGAGANLVYAGDGDDVVRFRRGDTVYGDAGNDDLRFAATDPSSTIVTRADGGAGYDTLTLEFSTATRGIASVAYSGGGGMIGNVAYTGVEKLVFRGGSGDDMIYGNAGDDWLYGNDGNDRLYAGRGANRVDGGAGIDFGRVDISDIATAQTVVFRPGQALTLGASTLVAIEGLGLSLGAGDDRVDVSAEAAGSAIYGGEGRDTLIGGGFADTLDGQAGADTLTGGGGNDTLVLAGGDTANGGAGDDIYVRTIAASDTGGGAITDASGSDTLVIDGSQASAAITGFNTSAPGQISQGGVTYFRAEIENYRITGSDNDDRLIVEGGGTSVVDGGYGYDQLTLEFAQTAAAVRYVYQPGVKTIIGGVTIRNIESLTIRSGGGNDLFDFSQATGAIDLSAGGGADTVSLGAMGGYVRGEDGDDSITAGVAGSGASNIGIYGGAGSDTVTLVGGGRFDVDGGSYENPDIDTLIVDRTGGVTGTPQISAAGFERLIFHGGPQDDVFSTERLTTTRQDQVSGGGGNDRFTIGQGNDIADGGAGTDFLVVDNSEISATQALTFVAGGTIRIAGDTISGFEGIDYAAGAGNDTLDVSVVTLASTVRGGNGNDTIVSGALADKLYGQVGNDVLVGRGGGDVMLGGEGRDTFRYLSIADSNRTTGADILYDFQVGLDRIDLAAIDANVTVGGDQAFRYIGSDAFSGSAGELRFALSQSSGSVEPVSDGFSIQGDVDGDGAADLTVFVWYTSGFTAADFVL